MARYREKEEEKPQNKVQAVYYSADLEMVRINRSNVRYRLKNPSGFGVQNLNHIEISRSNFPVDNDFSMDFINSDIPKLAKTGDKDNEQAVGRLMAKQIFFRAFKNLRIQIIA